MKRKAPWFKSLAVLTVASALTLTACSPGGRTTEGGGNSGSGQVASTPRIKIALVTHAGAGDTFWDIVRRGAEEAAQKDNVELLYTSDPEGGRQAQLVQQAIDQKVDGIAVSLAKPDALKDVLKKATDAGIPVVTVNSGADVFKSFGAFTHFGSDEKLAGAAVGEKLASMGVKHPICVITEQGNVALDDRCGGIRSKVAGTEDLFVLGTDMTQVSSTVTAKLQATPDADAIVGLGAAFTVTIVKAVDSLGLKDKVKVASFDLNGPLAQSMIDGDVQFTVDQQPWLQGYGAIDALWQYKRGGFKIGGGQPVLTGPAIVDKAAAPTVLKNAEAGIR